MTLEEFLYSLEGSELAFQVGATWWFPFIESLHVLAAALLLGSILMVDLRLLGLAARAYSVRALIRELVPWSWAAFLLAIVTGALLFIVQANNYMNNTAFLLKLLLLALAGINMVTFHFFVQPSTKARLPEAADLTVAPKTAKLNAGLSLFIWSGVMLMGRWIGHLA